MIGYSVFQVQRVASHFQPSLSIAKFLRSCTEIFLMIFSGKLFLEPEEDLFLPILQGHDGDIALLTKFSQGLSFFCQVEIINQLAAGCIQQGQCGI